jgi:hypothetical protein
MKIYRHCCPLPTLVSLIRTARSVAKQDNVAKSKVDWPIHDHKVNWQQTHHFCSSKRTFFLGDKTLTCHEPTSHEPPTLGLPHDVFSPRNRPPPHSNSLHWFELVCRLISQYLPILSWEQHCYTWIGKSVAQESEDSSSATSFCTIFPIEFTLLSERPRRDSVLTRAELRYVRCEIRRILEFGWDERNVRHLIELWLAVERAGGEASGQWS